MVEVASAGKCGVVKRSRNRFILTVTAAVVRLGWINMLLEGKIRRFSGAVFGARIAISAFAVGALIPTWAAAQTDEPLKIGYSMALSGGLGPNGRSALLAQKIWDPASMPSCSTSTRSSWSSAPTAPTCRHRRCRLPCNERRSSSVYDRRYPSATTDLVPVVRAIAETNPDLGIVCSYPPDSIGMVRAVAEVGFRPKMIGGAMVGLQSTAVKARLGPLLNGLDQLRRLAAGSEDAIRWR